MGCFPASWRPRSPRNAHDFPALLDADLTMLSADDAALASRDPALPGLATLLDRDRIVALLQQQLSLPAASLSLRATSIRYKPGTSCLVGFEGAYGGEPISLYGRLHPPEQRRKAAKPLERSLAGSALGPGALLLQEPCLLLMIFPNDHELKLLSSLVHPDRRDACLQAVLGEPPHVMGSRLSQLHYRPERRYVARLGLADGRRMLLKIHDRNHDQRPRLCANDFRDEAGLRLRPRLVYAPKPRLALYPWIDGTPLCESSTLDLLQHVGGLLARLHSLNRRSPEPARSGSKPSTEAVATVLQTTLEMLADLAPSRLERARSLAGRLLASWCAQPGWLTAIHCLVHGDFSTDQVILDRDKVWFIDFDRARSDHPVHDLGSCLARLHRQQMAADPLGRTAYGGSNHAGNSGRDDSVRDQSVPSLTWTDLEARCQAISHGYLDSSPWPLAPLIPLSLALHLFQLASEPFRQREPDWLLRLDQILTRIDHILQGNHHAA